MEKKKIIAGGGLVLNEQGDLLMIFRRGKWDLPKGKLDEGETIEACAEREVSEETGVKNIVTGELIGLTFHAYFDEYLREEVIKETHWFAMKATGVQELVPQTEEDITAIKWVNGQELSDCMKNSYPTIIEIIQKAGISDN